eukprot:364215-Chlamydomonas_euryale.AAC.9
MPCRPMPLPAPRHLAAMLPGCLHTAKPDTTIAGLRSAPLCNPTIAGCAQRPLTHTGDCWVCAALPSATRRLLGVRTAHAHVPHTLGAGWHHAKHATINATDGCAGVYAGTWPRVLKRTAQTALVWTLYEELAPRLTALLLGARMCLRPVRPVLVATRTGWRPMTDRFGTAPEHQQHGEPLVLKIRVVEKSSIKCVSF